MAQKIKKISKKIIAFICMITLVFSASVVNESKANAMTNIKLTLADSRTTNATGDYTLTFTGQAAAIKCVRVIFATTPTGSTLPTGMETTAGANVAAGWTGLTQGSWTFASASHGTIEWSYATGETPAGGNVVMVFDGIKNPSTAAAAYARVWTYSDSCGGTEVDSGVAAVAYLAEIEVSATVSESLSATVSSRSTAECNTDTGFTAVAASTSTSIPFGDILVNTYYNICQELNVTTNAQDGYSATIQEDDQLTDGASHYISAANDDGNCDGGCSDSTAATWTGTSDTSDGFGYCMKDTTGNAATTSGWAQQCDGTASTTFKTIASMTDGDTVDDIMSSAGAVNDTSDIMFRLLVKSTQTAGTYTNKIIYIITPTYN